MDVPDKCSQRVNNDAADIGVFLDTGVGFLLRIFETLKDDPSLSHSFIVLTIQIEHDAGIALDESKRVLSATQRGQVPGRITHPSQILPA